MRLAQMLSIPLLKEAIARFRGDSLEVLKGLWQSLQVNSSGLQVVERQLRRVHRVAPSCLKQR